MSIIRLPNIIIDNYKSIFYNFTPELVGIYSRQKSAGSVTEQQPAFTNNNWPMVKGNTFSDAELVSAIRTGDQLNNAILSIYQQFSTTISSFIINNSGSSQDAEDIFQETVVTFIDLVKKNKFRGESGVKTFLVSIARHLWLNELKKRERSGYREKVFERTRDQSEVDVSHLIADREVKQQFREVINKLGEHCKTLLTLYYYENLSMKELLDHLPYENEQVVRNKKYKCLQQLTAWLQQNPVIARLVHNNTKSDAQPK